MNNVIRIICFLGIFVILPSRSAYSEETPKTLFERVKGFKNDSMDSILIKFTALLLEPDLHSNILRNAPPALLLDIPVDSARSVTVDVHLAPLWDGELRIRTDDSVYHQPPLILSYQGKILGATTSVVALTFSDESIMGVISDSTGNYVISQIHVVDSSAPKYCIYNDIDLTILKGFRCGTILDSTVVSSSANKNKKTKGEKILTADCQLVRVDIECEHEMYQHFSNSLSRTAEYVVNIFNVVSAIYKNENINLFINELLIWTIADPYTIEIDDDPKMEEILEQFIDNRDTYSGNIAYLFRKTPPGWAAGGRADEVGDDLCDNDDAYAFSWVAVDGNVLRVGTYARDAKVFAHELGHLLDSPHTHWCGWNDGPIDNCNKLMNNPKPNESWYNWLYECDDGPPPPAIGGTIMSYCDQAGTRSTVSFANGFGPQPGDRIREYVDDYSYCLNSIPTSWCISNATFTLPAIIYNSSTIVAQNNGCVSTGNVVINNQNNAIFWIAGKSITFKPGFHKTNSGVFNARILPQLDCLSSTASSNYNPAKNSQGNSAILSGLSDRVASIQPNPATDEIRILGQTNGEVELYSSLGAKVLRIEQGMYNANIAMLPVGVYYARIPTTYGTILTSFVIVR